ncbi:hypothetical protein [Alicyclobacillus sp. ALC3]|uniref:hypothetical protein n=1 Tax=Alicyclobacillus sp. ALC3 TaxID=2796143 RepID=UPI00237801F1|nr:hypothetical protein [Alicyclobacillus sp. ALC3]WDL96397.1 hypothetical protein JC200_19035 [Alicyclobacillus sp. ALC3]
MDSGLRKIIYENKTASTYSRAYANASFVTSGIADNVMIDICEEFAGANFIASQTVEDGQFYPFYQHDDPGILHVTREFKHSFIMPKEQARQLAYQILSMLEGEGVVE